MNPSPRSSSSSTSPLETCPLCSRVLRLEATTYILRRKRWEVLCLEAPVEFRFNREYRSLTLITTPGSAKQFTYQLSAKIRSKGELNFVVRTSEQTLAVRFGASRDEQAFRQFIADARKWRHSQPQHRHLAQPKLSLSSSSAGGQSQSLSASPSSSRSSTPTSGSVPANNAAPASPYQLARMGSLEVVDGLVSPTKGGTESASFPNS